MDLSSDKDPTNQSSTETLKSTPEKGSNLKLAVFTTDQAMSENSRKLLKILITKLKILPEFSFMMCFDQSNVIDT